MKQYIEQNKERFFDELFSILRIPSISAKPENKPDMARCADRLKDLLLEAGADMAQVTLIFFTNFALCYGRRETQ